MCMCGQALGRDSVWVGESWAGLSVRVPEGCFHSSEWPVVWASEQLHPKVEPLCSCYKAAVVSVSHSPIVCGKSWVQRSALSLERAQWGQLRRGRVVEEAKLETVSQT